MNLLGPHQTGWVRRHEALVHTVSSDGHPVRPVRSVSCFSAALDAHISQYLASRSSSISMYASVAAPASVTFATPLMSVDRGKQPYIDWTRRRDADATKGMRSASTFTATVIEEGEDEIEGEEL